ncbi:ABC transporter permease [Alicyclobacillus sp. SO9]|uniref:ABC transporter permease n=1 Tax=Alicyclobacillus sp. SO9 TaxID=2665646 RepID=UPI0018E78869|nr:ABC transporter permease [Alicyclobacillus sp. SO9]QQE78066.1 ABC transporter permease [Alicyclobacillus sp. SO9]
MRELWILMQREMKVRLAKRGYWTFTVIGLILLIGLTFLPSIMNFINQKAKPTVMLNDPHHVIAATAVKSIQKNSDNYDFKLTVDNSPKLQSLSNAEAKSYLKTHHAKLVAQVSGSSAMSAGIVVRENGSVSSSLVGTIQSVLRQQIMSERIKTLPTQSQSVLSTPVHTSVIQLQPNSKSEQQMLSSKLLVDYMLVLLFATITIYGAWVAQGVVEEKSNRIVEMVLVTTKPWQILFGKIIGIGLVGLLQYAIWLIVAGGVILFRKHSTLLPVEHVPAEMLVLFPVFFILGYMLYATLYGIAGSLVTRVEEQQMALTPVVIIMLILFYVTLFGILPAPDSIFSTVASFVPIVTPMAMFARAALATNGVAVWQILISIGLVLILNTLLVLYGARVYKRFALRTSGKSSWRILWQKDSRQN